METLQAPTAFDKFCQMDSFLRAGHFLLMHVLNIRLVHVKLFRVVNQYATKDTASM